MLSVFTFITSACGAGFTSAEGILRELMAVRSEKEKVKSEKG
jgi:hypothetical protein